MKPPITSKVVLGIDPGFARIGYGVITSSGNTTRCLEYGCMTTSPSQPLSARLLSIHQELSAIIARTKPAVMAVEKLFFAKNVTTGIDVAQARGVIILTAQLHGVPLIELTPLQAKSAVGGHGQADKKQIQKMVAIILALEKPPTPDDAADALALAITASSMPIK